MKQTLCKKELECRGGLGMGVGVWGHISNIVPLKGPVLTLRLNSCNYFKLLRATQNNLVGCVWPVRLEFDTWVRALLPFLRPLEIQKRTTGVGLWFNGDPEEEPYGTRAS